jgi:hypothetical protein
MTAAGCKHEKKEHTTLPVVVSHENDRVAKLTIEWQVKAEGQKERPLTLTNSTRSSLLITAPMYIRDMMKRISYVGTNPRPECLKRLPYIRLVEQVAVL